MPRRCFRELTGDGTRYFHGAMVKPEVLFPDEHRRHHERKIWVVRNECLWKDGQLHSLGSGAADRIANAIDGAAAAREIRSNLDRCCFDSLHGVRG